MVQTLTGICCVSIHGPPADVAKTSAPPAINETLKQPFNLWPFRNVCSSGSPQTTSRVKVSNHLKTQPGPGGRHDPNQKNPRHLPRGSVYQHQPKLHALLYGKFLKTTIFSCIKFDTSQKIGNLNDPSWNPDMTFHLFIPYIQQIFPEFWSLLSCWRNNRLLYQVWFWIYKGEQKNLAKIGTCPFKVTSCAWPPPSNSGHGKSPLRDYPFGHSEGESTCRHHAERFLSVPWDVFQELFWHVAEPSAAMGPKAFFTTPHTVSWTQILNQTPTLDHFYHTAYAV